MTVSAEAVPPNNETVQAAKSDSQINFERQRKMYEAQLEKERKEKQEYQARLAEYEKSLQQKQEVSDDDDDDEPYVDRRKLKKTLSHYSERVKQETQTEIQRAVQSAIQEERKQQWIRQNHDFYEVMSPERIQQFADSDPELAETILAMPDTFERQKLVYKNIKAMEGYKKQKEDSPIRQQIERNRRNPYYQPSGIGAPGSSVFGVGGKDYSPQEGEAAYKKMQEMKQRLRLG